MDLMNVIDKVSVLYRSKRDDIKKVQDKKWKLEEKLWDAKTDNFEHMSHAEYEKLHRDITSLTFEINEKEKYCDGIFEARELLLNLLEK